MNKFKGMYETMSNNISSQKEFFGLIVAVIVATVGYLTWANANFITPAKAETMHQDVINQLTKSDEKMSSEIQDQSRDIQRLTTKIEASNQLMIVHMDKHALEGVVEQIESNKSEQFRNDQFIRANGSNAPMDARQEDLKRKLAELEMKKTCILNNNPLCD